MTERIHAQDLETARARIGELTGDVIVVWPNVPLAELVELMQSEPRVIGVIDGEPLPAPTGDGVDCQVREAREAAACMRAIGAELASRQIAATLRTAVEQVADELVTNALFDAPVDAHGTPLFDGMPVRRRKLMRTDRRVRVRCVAADGKVKLVVTDTFGSLRRATVLRHLYKCIHTERPVDTRTEGAGVGLYLTMRAATSVTCEVTPNRSTEITVTFEQGVERAQLVFTTHTAAPRSEPARLERLPDPRRATAVSLALGLVAVGATAFLVMRDAAPQLAITSEPAGAMVQIDGRAVGTTPIRATAGSRVRVSWHLPGHEDAHRDVTVPPSGNIAVHHLLVPSSKRARARVISEPAGAAIVATGDRPGRERRFTPATLEIEAGMTQRFTLEMPGYAPAVIAPFVVEAGGNVEHRVILQRLP